MATDEEVVSAVAQYAYERHRTLTRSNVMGFNEEDLDRLKVGKNGYLVFTIEDVTIEEKETDTDGPVWYVAASVLFQVTSGEPIESDADVYEAYMGDDGRWCIQWDHS
jgi:hypothetical protein